MPRPEVLRVLKMTPGEWGALPPESDSGGERRKLRAKADELLAKEAAARENPSTLDTERADAIEARLSGLEMATSQVSGSVSEIMKHLQAFEKTLSVLSKRLDTLEAAADAHKGKH